MGSQHPQDAARLRLIGQRPGASAPAPSAPPAPPAPPVPPVPPTVGAPTIGRPAPAGGFADTLHLAIEASGLSLDRIRAALAQRGIRVSVTTLSYWRRGRSQPERASSLRAVHLLEELLGLPHSTLSALLGPPRPRGRWAAAATIAHLRLEDVWPGEQEIADVFTELDAPPAGELERLSIHDSYYVDAERRGNLLRMRQVVRATVSGVTRCLVVHKADEEATGCPEITSVRHGRLGRVRRRPDVGLVVGELMLDRPLGLGDSTVFEYEVEIPPGGPTMEYSRRFATPVREYVLQVHFDPAAVPVHCERYDRAPGEDIDRRREQLWIGASASAHVLAPDQQPGHVGIRWEWE
ncbi:XRE family transcriptional regulator [Kitasatospora sp. NPDC058170]|uniref:XRE family transcriptional regulator n=1 Tax=Kitasatospora sp. NPDC058170 TaxID=3346364 RepID=UPI0036DDA870